MEIAILPKQTIRVKTKQASLLIDPASANGKTTADGILFLRDETAVPSNVSEYRLVIHAAGEYEVGGIKITGIGARGKVSYMLSVDGITVLVSCASLLEKPIEGNNDISIAIILADSSLNSASITALSPNVVVVYGEQATDAVKVLGKEAAPVQKYVTTSEKLPEEMEVVLLSS